MRAARMLWAKIVKMFDPKNPKSLSLRTHSQTSGWSLTAQDVYNNVTRTCVEAMAATQGQTQSLHTNSLDEALALPTASPPASPATPSSSCRRRPTPTRSSIPWGGSYYVEALTHGAGAQGLGAYRRVRGAWRHDQGDRGRSAQDADRRRGGPHPGDDRCGRQTIVGLNKYQPAKDDPINVLKIDNTAVRESQIKRLKELRAQRDQAGGRMPRWAH